MKSIDQKNNYYENYYILDDWENFLLNYDCEKSLFIGNIGFEERSTTSFANFLNCISDYSKSKFQFYYLESQGLLKDEMEKLGIKIPTLVPIEKKKQENISKIKKIKKENNLDIDIFNFRNISSSGHFIGYDEVFNNVKLELSKIGYTNVFLDISAFPRSVFIPLIKILFENSLVNNLFVIWTDKGGLKYEKNVLNYDQAETVPRFTHIDPESDDIVFWLPILSYDPVTINIVLDQRRFKTNMITYPLLTFPSIWPEETDNILKINKNFFIREHFDLDKILYVPSSNPFEFFLRIKDFYKSKQEIYEEKFYITISPFGTKAQSLGTCLAAILLKRISLLICRPIQYIADQTRSSDSDSIETTKIAFLKGSFY